MASRNPPAPLSLDVELVGLQDVQLRISALARKWPLAFSGALYMWATNVVSTAMKLTPYATGYLRESRYVTRPSVSGQLRFEIEMGFGAGYATYVHEVYRHYRVGEWKFLETAVAHHRNTALRDIAMWGMALAKNGQGIDQIPVTHPDHFIDTGRPQRVGQFLNSLKHLDANGRKQAWRRRRSNQRRDSRRVGREKDRNQQRIARESLASLQQQRGGGRGPRPGR